MRNTTFPPHTPNKIRLAPPGAKPCADRPAKPINPLLGTPRPVDVHVGARVRQRRTLLGMSQEKLGEGVGLTFQQIQKYERGANRIGASRLYQLANVLDVSVSYFFDEMPGEVQRTHGDYAAVNTAAQIEAAQGRDPMARRETLELVRAYYKIIDPRTRKRLFELTKSIASASEAFNDNDAGV